MTDASTLNPTEVEIEPTLAVQVDRKSGTAPDEISKEMSEAFRTLESFARSEGVMVSGPPRAIYTRYGEDETEFTVAFPIDAAAESVESAEDGSPRIGVLPGGPAVRFTHIGPYEKLSGTYRAIGEWLKKHGLLETEADWPNFMPLWEEYIDDPSRTSPDELVTFIYLPMKGSR